MLRVLMNYALSMAPFMLAGLLITVIIRYCINKKKTATSLRYEIVFLLFITFMTGLFSQTLIPPQWMAGDFSRFPYHGLVKEYIDIDFSSFFLWIRVFYRSKDIVGFTVNYIGNIVMFLPVGCCVPYLWKKNAGQTIFIGFGISFFIEFCQLFFDRVSDISDLILNTFGTILGYVLYIAIRKIMKKRK